MPSAAEDLLAVLRLLVDDPKGVAVEEAPVGAGAELRIRTRPEDRGQVIGRRGRTIDALRALARVRGEREGRALDVEIVED
jgi:predicted RNA-binding protein YlqC (UPF0109 family)